MESTAARKSLRRPRWQYPPSTRIIQLPRRPSVRGKSSNSERRRMMVENQFFDLESSFGGNHRGGGAASAFSAAEEQEKWRVEADMLRAECYMLRAEKEMATKKVEKKMERIERTLRSAVHVLLAGRERISEGDDVSIVLEEEIDHLVRKLQKLRGKAEAKDSEAKNGNNLNKQASFPKRRLERLDGTSSEICLRDTREMAEAILSVKPNQRLNRSCVSDCDTNMEILRKRMEALSKGHLLERMEKEYGSMISPANSSVTCSASSSMRFPTHDVMPQIALKEMWAHREKSCSGHCKAIVKNLVEQVKIETEQWSQMQEMLHQVKDEMEELQTAKNYWEDRAFDSERLIQSLHLSVKDWKEKAALYEKKTNELQGEVSVLKEVIKKTENGLNPETKEQKPAEKVPKEPRTETILGILVRRLKENPRISNDHGLKQKDKSGERRRETVDPKRLPLRDVGNDSRVIGQRSKLSSPSSSVQSYAETLLR
ncbi:PREDICTED: uncharacterized protein LOC104811173 isoform X2 [Tarenaya hassleriana]|uniref:uncharacterized protein LOC104811173 isoform X2 n=1 Tax=Tarenaya hassleriana TaxID=28532 RepID=UPI00053C172F|nr:PREDICTED: uncharacterized protein LOC104811173 isoform X2 [Tarenaya hassleriana]